MNFIIPAHTADFVFITLCMNIYAYVATNAYCFLVHMSHHLLPSYITVTVIDDES